MPDPDPMALRGGDGNDILMDGLGDKVTMGRRGVNHFVYLEHAGHDVIQEFEPAIDGIDLRLLSEVIAFADLAIIDTADERGVRITHGAPVGSIKIK